MKTQKSAGAKAPKPETTRINLSIGIETSKRLSIAAIMSNRTASEIVDELLRAGLKDWSLPTNLTDRASKRQSMVSVNPESGHDQIPQIADAA